MITTILIVAASSFASVLNMLRRWLRPLKYQTAFLQYHQDIYSQEVFCEDDKRLPHRRPDLVHQNGLIFLRRWHISNIVWHLFGYG